VQKTAYRASGEANFKLQAFCYNYWNRMQKKETMSLSQKIKAIKSPLMTSGDSLIDSFGLKKKR